MLHFHGFAQGCVPYHILGKLANLFADRGSWKKRFMVDMSHHYLGALPRRGYDELDDLFSGYLTAMEAMAHL